MTSLSRADISRSLEQLGLRAGDSVFVHSSLSRMGNVAGGAAAVVQAFLDLLGADGTLMVPTFTFSRTSVFDVNGSPSRTGAVTEAARQHPSAVRSPHPTHAPCAIGPLAAWLMEDHLLNGPLDIGSPEDRMAKAGGRVLLLGVDHRANSTIHVGEAYAGSFARMTVYSPLRPARRVTIGEDGSSREVFITSMPGCSRGFGAIEAPMREADLIADGSVGDAPCQLMLGQAVIDTTVRLLRGNPLALACESPLCGTCVPLRKRYHS